MFFVNALSILGSPITLALTIDREKGTAHFDFSGTGFEVYGVLRRTSQKKKIADGGGAEEEAEEEEEEGGVQSCHL